jgi:hypothetical protein
MVTAVHPRPYRRLHVHSVRARDPASIGAQPQPGAVPERKSGWPGQPQPTAMAQTDITVTNHD